MHLLPCLLLPTTKSTVDPKGAAAGWPTPFSGLLAQHWSEETAKLSSNIHKIIDTKTFSACLVESISEQLNRNEAETKQRNSESSPTTLTALEGILKMCLLFHQHLSLNHEGTGPDRRTDLRIMLNECKAVLRHADQVEMSWARIFKRFRLLVHVLEQIRRDWPTTDEDEDEEEGRNTFEESPMSSDLNPVVIFDTDYDEATEYFMSFGISMAPTTSQGLLYRRKKPRQAAAEENKRIWECRLGANQSVSMLPQLPPSRLNSGSRQRGARGRLFRHQLDNASDVGKEGEREQQQQEVNDEELTLNLNVTGENGS